MYSTTLYEQREKRKKQTIELYYSDKGTKEIASLTGQSVSNVYKTWHEAGLKKRMTGLQRKVKTLRDQGKCAVEISEELGIRSCEVIYIAKKVGNPFFADETAKSISLGKEKAVLHQYGTVEDRKQKSKLYVELNHPGWEYVDGFTGDNGTVQLRCKYCGNISEKSAVTIRHHSRKLTCSYCEEEKRKSREAEFRKQREREEHEKKLNAFLSKNFKQQKFSFSTCKECGAPFIQDRATRNYCSDDCMRRCYNRKHDKRVKRAKVIDMTITLEKVYKRDNGICWLCGEPCDYNDYEIRDGNFIVHEKYPSIDHVVPLAKGGNHTFSNVRLAHHYCNTLKSDSIIA